jgi:hypothetical protein
MPVKSIKLNELPKSTRDRTSPIKRTRDWKEAVEWIKRGNFEVLEIEFAPTTLQLGKATPLMFKRLLATELRKMGLADKWRPISRGKTLYVVPVTNYVLLESAKPTGEDKSQPKAYKDKWEDWDHESPPDAERRAR